MCMVLKAAIRSPEPDTVSRLREQNKELKRLVREAA